MTRLLCSIYKSSRKDEMYLYVPKADGLKRVPEALMTAFGTPRHVSDLLLDPSRKLARVDITAVLAKLASDGFFLQMPPPPEPWLIQPEQMPAWSRSRRKEEGA